MRICYQKDLEVLYISFSKTFNGSDVCDVRDISLEFDVCQTKMKVELHTIDGKVVFMKIYEVKWRLKKEIGDHLINDGALKVINTTDSKGFLVFFKQEKYNEWDDRLCIGSKIKGTDIDILFKNHYIVGIAINNARDILLDYSCEKLSKMAKEYENGKIPLKANNDENNNIPLKFDNNKIDWTLLPVHATEQMLKVFMFGEKKYERFNYLAGDGLDTNRLISACIRHLASVLTGEKDDSESNISHIAHAMCNMAMILEIENKRGGR